MSRIAYYTHVLGFLCLMLVLFSCDLADSLDGDTWSFACGATCANGGFQVAAWKS